MSYTDLASFRKALGCFPSVLELNGYEEDG